MRSARPLPRSGVKTIRAATRGTPRWSMRRVIGGGAAPSVTVRGVTRNSTATGCLAVARASGAPYSVPPPAVDGALAPPDHAAAAAGAAGARSAPARQPMRSVRDPIGPEGRSPAGRLARRTPPCAGSGSFGGGSSALEHAGHDLGGPGLLERLVQVPALGRLHARRAAGLAPALGDQPVGVAHQPLEPQEPLVRDPHAAGVPVV